MKREGRHAEGMQEATNSPVRRGELGGREAPRWGPRASAGWATRARAPGGETRVSLHRPRPPDGSEAVAYPS
eukprot:scaffold4424_cov150-Pinguiococcus_pyrenoidosus.AAC.1